jgi:hypothetical protein
MGMSPTEDYLPTILTRDAHGVSDLQRHPLVNERTFARAAGKTSVMALSSSSASTRTHAAIRKGNVGPCEIQSNG